MPKFCCSRSSTRVVVAQKTNSGKGRNGEGGIKYGFSLIKGKSNHSMEDYHVAKFINLNDNELGIFAIFDGHKGDSVPAYLQKHLFPNILKDGEFLVGPRRAIAKAYENTDQMILSDTGSDLDSGGSTAVTAILINGKVLWIANVGDSRAILSRRGKAKQLSVDHDPDDDSERSMIESKGGFVTNRPGDVPQVNGLLAVSRVFGDKNLKAYLNSEPDIKDVTIESHTEFLILASDGISKVMTNQEAVDVVKKVRDPKEAAKQLIAEALKRNSKDDISCIVIRFRLESSFASRI
ncbi:PREDICTED: probable protein phosphatase 2C 17 isoform X2 [Camelina sativa]|uniref:Probable protein phosphatase 2C 17 isoform X2 n=1 Tax=Camelina sativa TaxID=90675 RepID=A0ABM0WJM4_CAMSA|nr:PREDICTED: probable protein phosphatase 2C 17 isoform X2 [Camelina sativa]XP_010472030.1 PREDICTED: probable protein phosphatase 2C 17 isoform X2 [Camelina sativa]